MTKEEAASIHQRIDELIDKVGGLATSIGKLVGEHGPCREMVLRHEAALNDPSGIQTRLSRTETLVGSHANRWTHWVQFAGALIIAVVVGVLSARATPIPQAAPPEGHAHTESASVDGEG